MHKTSCGGDWWQLGPVKAVAIFSNPFVKHEAVEQRMLRMFWDQDEDSFSKLFELTHAYRFDKDAWLEQVLTQHRHGNEEWETYCFMHGLPTRNTGSWLKTRGGPTCGNAHCAALGARTGRKCDSKAPRGHSDAPKNAKPAPKNGKGDAASCSRRTTT